MKPMNIILVVVLAVTVAIILSDSAKTTSPKVSKVAVNDKVKVAKIETEVVYEQDNSVTYDDDEAS